MSEPITILLIDDHRVVRQGVRAFLATRPFTAAWGAGRTLTLEQAVAEALEASPIGNDASR